MKTNLSRVSSRRFLETSGSYLTSRWDEQTTAFKEVTFRSVEEKYGEIPIAPVCCTHQVLNISQGEGAWKFLKEESKERSMEWEGERS